MKPRRPLIGWARLLPREELSRRTRRQQRPSRTQPRRRRRTRPPQPERYEVNGLAMIVERFRLRKCFNPGYPTISYNRLLRLALAGKFPAVKVRGRWRTTEAEIDRLAARLGWRRDPWLRDDDQ